MGMKIRDLPQGLVDITTEEVFVEANDASNAVLTRVPTTLGSQVSVIMGSPGTDLYAAH